MITVRFAHELGFHSRAAGAPPQPFVPLLVSHGTRTALAWGLADSGAHHALFTGALATYLGLDLLGGEHHLAWGIGPAPLDCWRHELDLSILGVSFRAVVDFAPDWTTDYGLLGMEDLFAHFLVAFDQPHQRFWLDPLP